MLSKPAAFRFFRRRGCVRLSCQVQVKASGVHINEAKSARRVPNTQRNFRWIINNLRLGRGVSIVVSVNLPSLFKVDRLVFSWLQCLKSPLNLSCFIIFLRWQVSYVRDFSLGLALDKEVSRGCEKAHSTKRADQTLKCVVIHSCF